MHLQPGPFDQHVVVLVRTSTGSDHPDAFTHLGLGHVVGSSGGLDEVVEEVDELGDLFGLEPDEIEGSTGEIGREGTSAEKRVMSCVTPFERDGRRLPGRPDVCI
jgi:hypothetical protein